ncbi:tumor necrosis factor receptor superfamily member 1A [Esox lucius]|nr:tumor necrosis factor receptor superfamily member 1A [Esox lucius]
MAVLKGKWKEKNIFIVSTLLLMCWSVGLSAPPPSNRTHSQCQEGSHYLSKEGLCCGKCHQGFRLVKDCSVDNGNAECKPCSSGTYRESSNAFRNCDSCRKCVENEEVVSLCNRSRNQVCRCQTGFYLRKIDSETRECTSCETCGSGERVTQECTPESNTVCECSIFHYRDQMNKRTCLSCKNCTSTDCRQECHQELATPSTVGVSQPSNTSTTVLLLVFGCGFVFLLVVVMILACVVFWRVKGLSSFPSDEVISQGTKSTQKLIQGQHGNVFIPTDLSSASVCERELLSKLPDCVPKEIKISDFIYSVLEQVPPRRVKELVRSLGVSDRVIELAENDYLRDTKEAQYQMLKFWACGGSQGRGGLLTLHLLHDLLVKLRNMELGGAAEELETIYGDYSGDK